MDFLSQMQFVQQKKIQEAQDNKYYFYDGIQKNKYFVRYSLLCLHDEYCNFPVAEATNRQRKCH